ncbi:MAG: PorT family protein [Phaeodactylibacter sp.]|nr:PorT family protein [Phaeodactylibacter sp.]MCB9264300.1 PorT family protein [Lewinellaceae bacterium]MCB9290794.1 PorT family protein [Lewinellaceae bacterium]
MKKLFLLAISLLSMAPLKAQVAIGPRAGIHFARADFDIYEGLEVSDQVGLLAGLAVEITLGENFALQPELSYLRRGYLLEELPQGIKKETELDMEYLDAGALLKGKFGGHELGAFLSIGAFYSLALEGVLTQREEGNRNIFPVQLDDNFNRRDVTLAGGGGFHIGMGRHALFFDGRYLLGLKKIEKIEGSYPFTNRGMSISSGLLFRL